MISAAAARGAWSDMFRSIAMETPCTAYYTHNCQAFQRITRKIEWGYPRDNYACHMLAIVSARILCVPYQTGPEPYLHQ
jgi:hypothetical protein